MKRRMVAAIAAASLAFVAIGAAADDSSGDATELGEPQEVSLTAAQMIERSRDILQQMGLQSQQINKLVEAAREAADPAKLVCIVDKDGQLKQALEAAKVRFKNLQGATDAGDLTRAKYEFDVISVFGEQSVKLVSEANQCIGEETGFSGDTIVDFEIDEGVPGIDSNLLDDVQIVIVPPSIQSTVTGQ